MFHSLPQGGVFRAAILILSFAMLAMPAAFCSSDSVSTPATVEKINQRVIRISACPTAVLYLPMPPLTPLSLPLLVPPWDMLEILISSMVAQLDTVHLQRPPQAWAPVHRPGLMILDTAVEQGPSLLLESMPAHDPPEDQRPVRTPRCQTHHLGMKPNQAPTAPSSSFASGASARWANSRRRLAWQAPTSTTS